ncbi:O-methyltransferase ZRP4 [Dichanthelium oligosanthes]|uniref:O-methyltransferase ZRP4 n=1 Tax=Dichanthelium oligosanthes TaxID=888268 RepID=A0A1E5W339_9POAL|nr:O-methyltransferase ZRP4 [Dichanthelium oligosanthes]
MPQCNGTRFSRSELLQASVELRHALGYVKSMALRCAVKLGVADAIHRRGGSASLEDLLAELSLDASRLPCLRGVMRALAASGVFAEGSDGEYRLTAASSLLVDDGSSRGSLAPATLLFVAPPFVTPMLNLAEWLLAGADGSDSTATTAFEMTHGGDLWDVLGRDAVLSDFFNDALASDTRFVMDIAIRGSAQVFEGIASLVDVGGATGAAARAVAAAFRSIKCTVLDLPQVIDAVAPVDGLVDYVAGDMMEFVPPADAVLLKVISKTVYLLLAFK